MANREMSIKRDSKKCKYSQLMFEEVFAALDDYRGDANCSLGTVHSVKGKTFDGVLLVLKKRDANSRYYTKLVNCEIQKHEELRVLYVAMTRPRKLLVLVVPNDHLPSWEHKFLGAAAYVVVGGVVAHPAATPGYVAHTAPPTTGCGILAWASQVT